MGIRLIKKQRLIELPADRFKPVVEAEQVKHVVRGDKLYIRYASPVYARLKRYLAPVIVPPVITYYDWPGMVKPFRVQKITVAFLSVTPRGYLLNGLGTGKTLSTLWAYDWLRREGVARRALVLAPLSTLTRVWCDEVFKHLSHLTALAVTGSRQRRLAILDTPADLYVLNHDAIRIEPVLEKLLSMDFTHLIVDEGAVFRNQATDRWRALRKLAEKIPWAWWLTGTPMPNSPVDVWAQVRLITPERITPSKVRWRDMTMRQVSQFTWVPRHDAVQKCYQVMQPAVRFALEDCVDLPPHIFESREAELSKDQRRAFEEMMKQLATEVASGEVTAVNEAVKASKLLQILCGVVYDDDGKPRLINATPRLAALQEVVEHAGGKVIVFAPYKPVIAMLARTLDTQLVVTGDTPPSQRNEIFRELQHGEGQVLVAQPGTMAHGLTLTAAHVIVWYAPTYSNEVYEQAIARIRRPGQRRATVIVHLFAHDWERRIYQRLRQKQKLQGALLELFR